MGLFVLLLLSLVIFVLFLGVWFQPLIVILYVFAMPFLAHWAANFDYKRGRQE